MLILIGLGLAPPGSLSLEAWEALQSADKVYLEQYTNLGLSVEELAEFLKRPVLPADRQLVEGDLILQEASVNTVALCVIGDIFTATTHSVIYLECLKRDIMVRLFPNAGIMNAVGVVGLELYKYGQTVSIPYPMNSYDPTSYFDRIMSNRAAGLHTLCLLDIKADENRFMTIPEALALLKGKIDFPLAIGVCRIGTDNHVFAGNIADLNQHEWPGQPHSLIIPGQLNVIEEEFIERWRPVKE
jgi:diphthine methyl ester synthase